MSAVLMRGLHRVMESSFKEGSSHLPTTLRASGSRSPSMRARRDGKVMCSGKDGGAWLAMALDR
jgi:hypothetical protein